MNALGQTLTMSDRNGSTHTLTLDVLGRVVSDAVTTLGSGVDGAVRRIETAYDGQGNAYLVTSYDAASGGSVVNQVQRAFNGLGQLVTEYQEHGGAVNTSTSPKVQYAYSEMSGGANHSRPTSMTYPSGYVLTYNYASGLNSDVSRLTSLSDANGTLESYDHLGFGTVVRRGHSQPNVDLSFIKRSGESNTDAGDQYTGLDRFGRVIDQRWMDATSGTSKDRLGYTYDQMGNRTARTNAVNSSFDESYTYDGLNQLLSFARGSDAQQLDYDAVGNWESVTTNGSTQTRGHNKQNEITSVSGATAPTFDANGNMTGDETGRQFVYDAWNRLVTVKNSGGTTLKTYTYDGLNRRASETASGTTRDLYYSAQWQVLEERVSGTTERRYVWSPVYVDALVLRDRDTNADGSLDERLYVIQDANFNVVALVDTSGNVVERYTYTPFGVQTVYDANWTVRGGGSAYSFTHGFQGLRYDATSGLNYTHTRPYSPTLARFTGVDWILFDGGDVNLYRAMGNNTVNRVDPSGNFALVNVFVNPFQFVLQAEVVGGGVVNGEFYWHIKWKLPAIKKLNGAIIQYVNHNGKIYVEAWPVIDGVIHLNPSSAGADDIYGYFTARTRIYGYAKFVPGYKLDKNWRIWTEDDGRPGPSGSLLVYMQPNKAGKLVPALPPGWTNTGAVGHHAIVETDRGEIAIYLTVSGFRQRESLGESGNSPLLVPEYLSEVDKSEAGVLPFGVPKPN